MAVGNEQAHGNAEVVAMLERYLEHARQGQSCYIAIVLAEYPKKVAMDAGGVVNMEPVGKKALEMLTARVEASMLNCTLPDRDPNLGADYVCFDAAKLTLSFDFLAWLVDREMTRVREGAPAPLKVAFWFGRDGKEGLALPGRRQMLVNVVKPSLSLLGAVEDDRAMLGRASAICTVRDIATYARRGEKVPIFRTNQMPPLVAVNGKPVVTITLREAEHWRHRNSNIRAWTRFARDLRKRGERVIFVRDTRRAAEPLDDFEICPEASTNLHARAALYASAKANLFVSNGPQVLAQFSDRPWLCFVTLDPDGHQCFFNTPAFWRSDMNVEPGEQFPWSGPDQRIVWGQDSYENITAAWEKLGCSRP